MAYRLDWIAVDPWWAVVIYCWRALRFTFFLAEGEGGSYDKLGELSAAGAGLRRHLEPPLPLSLARAFVAKAVAANELAFATVIALGFHGLLPTGELMALRFKHLQLNAQCGVISLPCSKAGQRSGSQEAIAVRDAIILQLLDTLVSVQKPAPGDPVWPKTSQLFRQEFRRMCDFFGITSQQFKPYSLRRGGATFLLQAGMPLESILLRGRWRLYLEDGLAQLPALRLTQALQLRVARWEAKTPST